MLKLHHAPNSRAGRIVWLLEELQLPYELNRMEFHPKALKSDEHRARHPLGRVPVLEDGEVMLYESGAIVEYIIARHSNGALKPAVREGRIEPRRRLGSGAYGQRPDPPRSGRASSGPVHKPRCEAEARRAPPRGAASQGPRQAPRQHRPA